MEPINVLSLFDGISCGQIALERAGIPVDNYYASEIDKHAIKVTQHNYPNTIQLGSVCDISVTIDGIFVEGVLVSSAIPDLLIGGSPCQGFSFAGKQLNFNDPRSALFFEYVRILKDIRAVNHDVKFFLENVKMKKEFQDVITEYLGVEPIEVNSALVSAQNRKRLYWTNIEGFLIPEDKGILLRDIVHENEYINEYMDNFNVNPSGKGMNGTVRSINNNKSQALTTNKGEGQKISIPLEKYIISLDKTLDILEKEIKKGKIKSANKDTGKTYFVHGQQVEIFDIIKAELKQLTDRDFDISINRNGNIRPYRNDIKKSGLSEIGTVSSVENKSVAVVASHAPKIHTYVFGCITPDRIEKIQNGQRFSEGKKFYTLTAQDRHGILIEGYIRKLTPIECERLQTVPDGYSEIVSDSQRYKALGNGWTVDVIVEFFKNLKSESTEFKTLTW